MILEKILNRLAESVARFGFVTTSAGLARDLIITQSDGTKRTVPAAFVHGKEDMQPILPNMDDVCVCWWAAGATNVGRQSVYIDSLSNIATLSIWIDSDKIAGSTADVELQIINQIQRFRYAGDGVVLSLEIQYQGDVAPQDHILPGVFRTEEAEEQLMTFPFILSQHRFQIFYTISKNCPANVGIKEVC